MALISNASGDYIRRTANLPASTAFTMAGWFYRVTDRNAYESFFELTNGTGYQDIQATTSNVLELNGNDHATQSWSSEPPTGEWFYLAHTSDASNHKGYWYDSTKTIVEGVKSATRTSSYTPTEMGVLGNVAFNEWVNGKCAYVRVWDAVLSQSEIEAEMASRRPVRTTNLNTAIMSRTGTDVSGNARDWTLNSITVDTDAPSGLTGIEVLQSMFWQRDSSGVSSHTENFGLNVMPGSVLAGYLWAVYDQARTMTAFTAKSGTDTGTVVHQDTARINMAYIKNATGGATDITFTLSGTNSYDRLWAFEIAGCDTTDPYDGHNVSDDAVNFGLTTDAMTSGSITTTAAGDVLAVVGWNGNERTNYPTTGTGFISDGTWDATTVYDCTRMEHKVLGAAGSYAGTFTQPSDQYNYSAAAMAFKAASGSTPRRRILFIN